MYAKNPATSAVASSKTIAMRFWLVKASIDSPSATQTTPRRRTRQLQSNVHARKIPVCCPREDQRAAMMAHPIRAQNKVLAIMEHEFFNTQAYRRTGSVSDSTPGG